MRTPAISIGWCLLAALAPAGAVADALTDLRALLHRYPASAPFSADATLQARGRSQDLATSRVGSTTFTVKSGVGGLTVGVPPAALQRAAAEAQTKKNDPDSPTPERTAMVSLTIFDIIDGLDAAALLLDALDRATLMEQTASSHAGKPATLLRIKVKPTLAGTRSKVVKEPDIELRVWLDSAGLPVAAERESRYSASIVIAGATNTRKERWEFAVAGDRIYASRNEQEDRASAAGKTLASWRAVTYAAH